MISRPSLETSYGLTLCYAFITVGVYVLFSYLVEVLEDGGEGPAGRAPVGGEVEADDGLAGEDVLEGLAVAAGAQQSLALQKVHGY